MTTEVRRIWVNYDSMGNPNELRADFTDKLSGYHIGILFHRDPVVLAQRLLEAAHGLRREWNRVHGAGLSDEERGGAFNSGGRD